MSAAVHAILIAWALAQPQSAPSAVAQLPDDAQRVAIAPAAMPALSAQPEPEPEPDPPAPKVQPPQDAVPLGPDSKNPDVLVPREKGPMEPEPEIDPPAAPGDPEPAASEPAPAPEKKAPRIPSPSDYAFAMSRFRSPTSPFGSSSEGEAPAERVQPAERTTIAGAMGRVGMSASPDTRDWRPSFPDAAGRCVDIPDLGNNPDGSPILASVLGRVYEADGRTPLIGAHLQIVGTRFVTFSSGTGDYKLEFDPKLLERCRVQYVRVSADGYDGRMLTLSIGRKIRSDDVLLRRR